jgi:hypothetical protein
MRAVHQKFGASIVECGDDRFRVRSDCPQACECSSYATQTEDVRFVRMRIQTETA